MALIPVPEREGKTMVVSSDLMTRKEAAVYLGVKEQTLASWAHYGKYSLPYVRVGRGVRYRKSELDKWLESRTVGGGATQD